MRRATGLRRTSPGARSGRSGDWLPSLAEPQPIQALLVHAEEVADLVPHRAAHLVGGGIRVAEDHDPLQASDRVVDAHQPVRMAALDDDGDIAELRGEV